MIVTIIVLFELVPNSIAERLTPKTPYLIKSSLTVVNMVQQYKNMQVCGCGMSDIALTVVQLLWASKS